MEKKMNKENSILSDITVYMKYARYLDDKQRRENWKELCDRNMKMHIEKHPSLKEDIQNAYSYVLDKKVLPSMRSMQFAGKPIGVSPNRIFNCAYCPVDHQKVFSEVMFLLLGGTGVGFSVQTHHIEKLPEIKCPSTKRTRRFLIGDSIEGWSDAIHALMKSYFTGSSKVRFDFSDIRPKGARLITSGGKAPGPQPLKECLVKMEGILDEKESGDQLTSIEVHDLVCHIADAVLAGGIRRAALISLFSIDDEEMLSAKSGEWYETNPQRGRANNSVVLMRNRITKNKFLDIWERVKASGSGEPGFYFTNDAEYGANPCCLTGDNKILTSQGYEMIEDLPQNTTINFVNLNGEVVEGIVYETGEKASYEIKSGNTKDPFVIRATEDHRFMLNNGEECEAQDLYGKRLMPFYAMKKAEESLDLKYGFLFGDGSFRANSELHKNIECSFTPVKDDSVKRMFLKTGWSSNKTTFTVGVSFEELQDYGIDTSKASHERKMIDLLNMEKEDACDFLTGLYSANGSIVKGARVALKTTSEDVANKINSFYQEVGIKSYVTTNKAKKVKWDNGVYVSRKSYDVNISDLKSVIKFAKNISFVQEYKTEALENLIKSKAPYVYSVTSIGIQKVYDFSLFDDTHWGVVNGIVTHNCEISLRPFQFCNLTEVNVSDVDSQEEYENRVWAATVIGTLQASYTDFHYLRPVWKRNTEKDYLIGVSMTGIASGKVLELDMPKAAELCKKVNKEIANKIGIKAAARTTTVKPAGTTSLTLGTSSGIHAWHNEHYIRRIRVGKGEAIYGYLKRNHPEIIKEDFYRPHDTAVIEVPQRAPEGSITRSESAMNFLSRVKSVSADWVKNGHRRGPNTNNVSATITVKPGEWDSVGEWMWENRSIYNGLSILPFSEHTYKQAPFEDCTSAKYSEMIEHITNINLDNINEEEDNTDLTGEIACSGGACELK